jgi:peptidyl-prolyl cis-trans isomerase SurA
VITLLLAVSALGGVDPGAPLLVDRLAAIVDDDPITLSEVYDLGGNFVTERCPTAEAKCVRQAELEILDAAIKRSLIRSQLQKLDLSVTGTDVDQAIDRIVKEYQLEDRAALRTEVEGQGMRWDTYREQLTEQLAKQRFQSRVLAPRVTVTDDELHDRYQKSVGATEAVEVEIRAIGIAVPPEATEAQKSAMSKETIDLISSINAGKTTWDEAVASYDGAHLADVFGGKKWRKGQLLPALDAIAFTVPVGQAEGPLVLNNLIMVMEVANRGVGKGAPGSGPSFEELEPKLRDQIFGEKLDQAEEEWYQVARRQASIQVLLEDPSAAK